jgi:hypothetical protein
MEMTNKFRPQDISKHYVVRMRLKTGRSENYNWQTRAQWHPAGWKSNQISIGRRFARLHYLACHAPGPVKQKWRIAYINLCNRLFAQAGRASIRYLNKYTAHTWL